MDASCFLVCFLYCVGTSWSEESFKNRSNNSGRNYKTTWLMFISPFNPCSLKKTKKIVHHMCQELVIDFVTWIKEDVTFWFLRFYNVNLNRKTSNFATFRARKRLGELTRWPWSVNHTDKSLNEKRIKDNKN